MAGETGNDHSWKLKSFLDSFILELDKAQDTLAIKGLNQPLTYTVKDVSLDLQLFPEFDGREVRFTNARPGENGASKLSLQLGSITDRQIRQTTKQPATMDELYLEEVDELDEETKDSFRKIGVATVGDLEKLEERKIDISRAPVFENKQENMQSLADKLKKLRSRKQQLSRHFSRMTRRQELPPKVNKITLSEYRDAVLIRIAGENLALTDSFRPIALVNDQPAAVISQSMEEMNLKIDPKLFRPGLNDFRIALDPYSVLNFKANL